MNELEKQTPEDPQHLFRHTMWVWFFSMLAIRLVQELSNFSWLRDYVSIMTAAILVYMPLLIFHRRGEKPHFFESSLKNLGRSLLWCLGIAIIVFPILEFQNRFYQEWAFGKHYVAADWKILIEVFLFHFFVVAMPEEVFYRGYMQTQFNRVWGQPWKFFGASFGKGLFFTCFIFALSHSLMQLQWWHFSIFIPSLVFGWLRDKTQAVTASSLFHALSNVYASWVFLSYR